MQIEGHVFRELENRRTVRFQYKNRHYFVKAHKGVGWKTIISDLFRLRTPVLGAKNEWQAIHRLQHYGIPTMTAVGYGERGLNPATKNSFIITQSLEKTVSLEELTTYWSKNKMTSKPEVVLLKKALIKKVALIARNLHSAGVNHRDFYLCHFLLHCPDGITNVRPGNLQLYLIDLHRTQIRKKVPLRWLIKDLAGLFFSTFGTNLTQRDYFRFIKIYSQNPLKEELIKNRALWNPLNKKAKKIYKRYKKKFL